MKRLGVLGDSMALVMLTGCGTTLFQSNFDTNPLGQPPSHTQEVGTIDTAGDPGGVVVASLPPRLWAEISRIGDAQKPPASMQCDLLRASGPGIYTFSAFLFIPSAPNNVATVQFEPFGWPVSDLTGGFLHIDFLQDNRVRIDDNANTTFGTFPRDQPFILQVTLNLNASPTAHIVLAGAGAEGVTDYTLLPPFLDKARQFGGVRFWMGFPWTGKFDATQIVVTYRAQ